MGDADTWFNAVRTCKYLPEPSLKSLIAKACEIFMEEPNVQPISTPVIVCGDIHGQFYDLEELFRTGGEVRDNKYVFMGDYVDRGYYSVETFTQLLMLKVRFPRQLVLLRGNHECRQITQTYGFYDECMSKYGNANVWKECCRAFDMLPIVAIIDEQIMCVHGGLSPDVLMLDEIRTIERNEEIPNAGAFCDLVWSDPEHVRGWARSPRGAGFLFGKAVVDEFLCLNNLDLICRAHQLVDDGIKYMFNSKLVTVWSAPNYCYRCGNVAAILHCQTVKMRIAKIFKAVPDRYRVIPDGFVQSPYFL